MNFFYSASFVLFILCLSCRIIHGCFNNQRTGFCPRRRTVFQDHCPNVTPWSCNWAELRCGCVAGTARRSDGKCVKPDEC
ncbi:hypothetical protein V5799_012239, partial [Amblyomma americanum]